MQPADENTSVANTIPSKTLFIVIFCISPSPSCPISPYGLFAIKNKSREIEAAGRGCEIEVLHASDEH